MGSKTAMWHRCRKGNTLFLFRFRSSQQTIRISYIFATFSLLSTWKVSSRRESATFLFTKLKSWKRFLKKTQKVSSKFTSVRRKNRRKCFPHLKICFLILSGQENYFCVIRPTDVVSVAYVTPPCVRTSVCRHDNLKKKQARELKFFVEI